MILVSYDGSVDAQAAIDHAAKLMHGAETAVLTIWEPFAYMLAMGGGLGLGLGLGGRFTDDPKIDEDSEQRALVRATEGATRATEAGLVAHPQTATRHDGGIARVILSVAGQLDAELVVLGTRGLGAAKSVLLGSVSHAVVQHADRAVLIVPSPELAKHRHGWARHADAVLAGGAT